jgi:5-methylcytosine-specific restriction endonuclease McrA
VAGGFPLLGVTVTVRSRRPSWAAPHVAGTGDERRIQPSHCVDSDDGRVSRRPTRGAIPRELRLAVFERDDGSCVQCGSSFDLQYDHVLSVALGRATTLGNLQLLCAECNGEKSDFL